MEDRCGEEHIALTTPYGAVQLNQGHITADGQNDGAGRRKARAVCENGATELEGQRRLGGDAGAEREHEAVCGEETDPDLGK